MLEAFDDQGVLVEMVPGIPLAKPENLLTQCSVSRAIVENCKVLSKVHFEFYWALLDTSDQLIQLRKQKPEDGRLVRLFVTENQIDRWRIPLKRPTRCRRR